MKIYMHALHSVAQAYARKVYPTLKESIGGQSVRSHDWIRFVEQNESLVSLIQMGERTEYGETHYLVFDNIEAALAFSLPFAAEDDLFGDTYQSLYYMDENGLLVKCEF